MLIVLTFVILNFLNSAIAEAQVIESNPACQVRVCSQNMYNFGSYKQAKERRHLKHSYEWQLQNASLVLRLRRANCDLIALQEVLKDEQDTIEQNLFQLITTLKTLTGNSYRYVFVKTEDLAIALAFLYQADAFKVLFKEDLSSYELPKLNQGEKPSRSNRGPLRVIFEHNCQERLLFDVYNFHFKSKSTKGGFDATGFGFELQRMQEAEFLRNYIDHKSQTLVAEKKLESRPRIVFALGDRNSEYQSASAAILTGTLKLSDFSSSRCGLSKTGFAYCKAREGLGSMISVFGGLAGKYPKRGSFNYKNKHTWIDDMLIQVASPIGDSRDSMQIYSGLISSYEAASDHALIFADLQW